jgi:hypothetical protein
MLVLSAPQRASAAGDQVSCATAGPQAPCDVTMAKGNRISFAKAPPAGAIRKGWLQCRFLTYSP